MNRKIIIGNLEAECEDWRDSIDGMEKISYDPNTNQRIIHFYDGRIKLIPLKQQGSKRK